LKVLFDVNHAGHVHFIRNAYEQLIEEGYECLIVASDKPLVYKLLNEYALPYHPMGKIGKSLLSKFIRLFLHNLKLLLYCLKEKPNVILGIVAIRGAHVGWLLRIRSIVFTDTEHATMQIALFKPFANEIHSPNWFASDLGPKHIRYNGFHELAYLHPKCFKPRTDVLAELGLEQNQTFSILRFVAWDATHDKNQFGLNLEGKKTIVEILSKIGKVFITSEYSLEPELKPYELQIPVSYLHDALSFSTIVVSEGATTACESAILGIPTIYTNTLSLGYISYLEEEHDLLYHMTDQEQIINKIKDLLRNENLKVDWDRKKEKFLETQQNTTDYIINMIKKDNT